MMDDLKNMAKRIGKSNKGILKNRKMKKNQKYNYK